MIIPQSNFGYCVVSAQFSKSWDGILLIFSAYLHALLRIANPHKKYPSSVLSLLVQSLFFPMTT